jgi:TM2 domain-containing membrane protein YozV
MNEQTKSRSHDLETTRRGEIMYRMIGADGHQYGPVTADVIRQWLAENRVNGQTLIQREGETEWKPLQVIPEFAADLRPAAPGAPGAVPPPLSRAPSLESRAANKIPAGVCGILLGSLGIHKFILGYTGAGVLMLLITLIGGFFTCGIASAAMHVIGLIEGILYLCKTDEEFVRTYVDSRKEWF